MELRAQMPADRERLRAHAVVREQLGPGRQLDQAFVPRQPGAPDDHVRDRGLDADPAPPGVLGRLDAPAERGGQRVGAGAQSEDRRARAIGLAYPLELGVEPATGAVVDDRVGGAEHDRRRERARVRQRLIAVDPDGSRTQSVMVQHVHQQPGRDVIAKLQDRGRVARDGAAG